MRSEITLENLRQDKIEAAGHYRGGAVHVIQECTRMHVILQYGYSRRDPPPPPGTCNSATCQYPLSRSRSSW